MKQRLEQRERPKVESQTNRAPALTFGSARRASRPHERFEESNEIWPGSRHWPSNTSLLQKTSKRRPSRFNHKLIILILRRFRKEFCLDLLQRHLAAVQKPNGLASRLLKTSQDGKGFRSLFPASAPSCKLPASLVRSHNVPLFRLASSQVKLCQAPGTSFCARFRFCFSSSTCS